MAAGQVRGSKACEVPHRDAIEDGNRLRDKVSGTLPPVVVGLLTDDRDLWQVVLVDVQQRFVSFVQRKGKGEGMLHVDDVM